MSSGVEVSDSVEAIADQSMSHVIHRVLQFLRVVRSRLSVVVVAVVLSALLGSLYYATATRYYRADASVLILRHGSEVAPTSMGGDGSSKEYMPTYEQLLKSAVVLQEVCDALPLQYRVDLEGVQPSKRVEVLTRNLSLSTVRKTNIIRVSYRSKSPEAAVGVVNELLKAYFAFIDRTHKSTAGQLSGVLERERGKVADELAAKEQELIAAREGFGDIGTDESNTVHPATQRAVRLNDVLIEAHQERLKYQAALSAIQNAIRTGADLRQHLMAAEQTVGRAMLQASLGISDRDARTQAELERSLLKDRAEATGLSEFYGGKHPRVAEVNGRIATTERYLAEYGAKVKERLSTLHDQELGPMLTHMMEQSLANAWQQEHAIRSSFAEARAEAVRVNGGLARLEIIEHAVTRLRELNDVLVERIASVDLRQEQGDIRTTVVQDAIASKTPVTPRLLQVVFASLFGGLILGGGAVFVQDALDDRFRSPDDVTMRLGVPTLAMVSKFEVSGGSGMDGVQAHCNPNAPESEAFRTLRAALSFNADETRQLVVSSAEPGDGKTTVLANLGVAIAQSNKKVLLIDADLRRPGLTNLFMLKKAGGLSDVLRSHEGVADMARRHILGLGVEGLDILPSGPRRPNPAELLTSKRLEDLLAWAETHYDQILIDSPPVLAASDAMMLGRIADGVMLVINPDKNRRRVVMRSFENLRGMNVNVLGVVANRIDADSSKGYGYGYGYTYSYQYGETDAEQETLSYGAEREAPYAGEPVEGLADPSPVVPRKVA